MNGRLMQRVRSDELLRKLTTSGMTAIVIRMGSAALNFVALAAVAQWLGPVEYGDFALMFALGVTLGLAATGGYQLLTLRRLPGLEAGADRAVAAELVRAGYRFVFGASSVMTVVLCGAAQIEAITTATLPPQVLIGAAALILPIALAEYQLHLLRAVGAVTVALLPRDVLWYAAIALLSLVAIHVGKQAAQALTAFVLLSALLGLLIAAQGVVVARCVPVRVRGAATPQAGPGRHRELLWLWLSTVVEALQRHFIVVVAGAFLAANEVGALFAAQRTSLLLSLPLIAVNVIGAPMIAKAWSAGDLRQVQIICKLIALGASLPSLAGVAVLMAFGDVALALFSPDYAQAAGALALFAAASLFNALCGPSGFLLLMTDQERPYVLMRVASLVIGLTLTSVLAYHHGLIGAAVGGAADMVLRNVLEYVWARRRLGIDSSILAWLGTPGGKPNIPRGPDGGGGIETSADPARPTRPPSGADAGVLRLAAVADAPAMTIAARATGGLPLSAASSRVRPLETTLRRLGEMLFHASIFTGFLVLVEPAPTDLLFVLALGALLAGGFRRGPVVGPVVVVGCLLYLVFSVVSMVFVLGAPTNQLVVALRALAVEIYLLLLFLVTAYFARHRGDQAFTAILMLWLAGALIAAALGVLAKLQILPNSQIFFRDEFMVRVSSTFKDPNVLGPFLVPPILFAVWIAASGATRLTLPALFCAGLMTGALVITYSRGAWGHLALSLAAFAAMLLLNRRTIMMTIAGTLAAGMIAALVLPILLDSLSPGQGDSYLETRLALQNYDSERFSAIWTSIEIALENPLGIGPNQGLFADIILPHNTFVVFAYHNGIPALIGFTLIFICAVARCVHRVKQGKPGWIKYGMLLAVFIGLFVLMNVIGAIHWRHLFVLMGLSFGDYRSNDILPLRMPGWTVTPYQRRRLTHGFG